MKSATLTLIALVALLSGAQAHAGSVDFSLGFFSLTANNPKGNAQISNLGVYELVYKHPLFAHFSAEIGYAALLSNTVSGDVGSGFVLGGVYYPLNTTARDDWSVDTLSYSAYERWRPYAAISFQQRDFQSIQFDYIGAGFEGGTEYGLTHDFALKGFVRYLILGGPGSNALNEMDICVGVSLWL